MVRVRGHAALQAFVFSVIHMYTQRNGLKGMEGGSSESCGPLSSPMNGPVWVLNWDDNWRRLGNKLTADRAVGSLHKCAEAWV